MDAKQDQETELNVNLKLYYFDFPGKAEALRLAMAYCNIPFEDYRFKSREEFLTMKKSGELMFGQVPALQVTPKDSPEDSTILNQSAALLRFIGKFKPKLQLYPGCPLLASRVDAIVDQEADTLMGLRVTKYKSRFGFGFLDDPANAKMVEAAQSEIITKIIPGHLAKLEAVVKERGTVWLGGTSRPSIADFQWAPVLKSLGLNIGQPKLLEEFPLLKRMVEHFYELDAVKKYYSK